MSKYFKKFIIFLACAALFNATLVPYISLFAKESKTTQRHETTESTKNDVEKKPTFKESWHKVLTLRLKELGRADAWNIGAPFLGVAALSLAYFYWPNNLLGNINQNPDNDNPDNGNNILPAFIQTQQKDMPRLSEILVDDIQKQIALNMIREFLMNSRLVDLVRKEGGVTALNNLTTSLYTLDADEFKDPNHALFWIKHNLLPLQANLITRAYAAMYRGNYFIISINTDDAHIWITFPAHVREYLMGHLNIQLQR